MIYVPIVAVCYRK